MTKRTITNGKVEIAVVGLGFMGVTHLRAYLRQTNVHIAAVCDPRRGPVGGVLAGVAGNIGESNEIRLDPNVKVYRSLDEVLADPAIDVVDLCTPTPLHADQAIAALRAGKHVLCEKPLARTSADARRVLAVAEASSGFLMPAMCMRFWPGWQGLNHTIKTGEFGPVLAARFRRVSERPNWSRQGTYTGDMGGALFDLHIHDTDFIHHLFGPPEAVFSTGVIDAAGSIDHIVTQYIYPGGPVVSAEGSWLQAMGFNMEYTIHCAGGTCDLNFARDGGALHVCEISQPARPPLSNASDGYNDEILYFVACVTGQIPPSVVTPRDAVAVLEICEAEEKSLRTGSVVELCPPHL